MYFAYSPFAGIWMVLYYMFTFLITNGIVILELIGLWFTFRKMHLPGWKGLIPFYSTYVLFDELWEKKHFWRVIIYLCISFGTSVIGSFLMTIGAVNAGSEFVNVLLIVLGASLLIACLVFAVLSIVIEFKLFFKMAKAFGLKSAWAWGMIFVPFVMFPIIGFNRKIVYYGPVSQV